MLPARLLLVLLFTLPQLDAAEPAEIGSRLELFVDHSLIDSMDGVELRLNTPIKTPRPKSPLPERHYITVIRDGDLFRAYWRDSTEEENQAVRYAESTDGHEWTFPELGDSRSRWLESKQRHPRERAGPLAQLRAIFRYKTRSVGRQKI